MDAKTMISLLIVKLQNLLPTDKGLMNVNRRTQKQVETAIKNLRLWKRCLKDDDDSKNDLRIDHLLQAYYSAEDAINTLPITNELYGYSNVRWPLKWFHVLRLEFFFTNGMKKFKNVVRGLSFYDHQLEMIGVVEKDIEDSSDAGQSGTKCLRSGNDAGEQSQQPHWGRISDLYVEEETKNVGRERETKELLLRLIPQGNDRDNSTKVIALIGSKGSGKTTLARSVYNRVDVKMHFRKRAWVHVPIAFKAKNALADILIQIARQPTLMMEAKTLQEKELMQRITHGLEGSTFLIVMESVENTDIWQSVICNFCSSTQRGVIIITTCTADYNVPPEANYSTLHVRGLNKEDSWKLFVKKARTIEAFSDAVKLKFEETILKTCSALPLPLVLLGGVLSTKENKENVCLSLFDSCKTCTEIVALCYEELPSQLKPCFLYMGIFPREYEIPVRRLIHLWCAEGFVTPLDSKEKAPEELAETYFEELVIRNMIQVIRRRSDGIPKTCRMQGVFYDELTSKGENIGFFHLDQPHSSLPVRRLAVNVGSQKNIPSSALHLRSYIAFDHRFGGTPAATEINTFLAKLIDSERIGFGMLNVLDLEGVSKPRFTKAVAERLPLLRYLGLKSTSIYYLPDVKLLYLETLDVRHTRVRLLPSSLSPKRHIYLNWFNLNWSPQDSDVKMQTLWGFYVENKTSIELSKFKSLRSLGLKCISTSTVEKIADSLLQLTQLQSLKLILEPRDGKLPHILLEKLADCSKLQQLYLHGILPSNTEIGDPSFPPNLTTLTLSQSNLDHDPMPGLGRLSHLTVLRLFGESYQGIHLKCLSGGFPKLQVLKLWRLPNLVDWTVEKDALRCLGAIEIRSCENLSLLELVNVTTLREFVSTNMPPEFDEYVKEIVGRNVYIEKNEWHPWR